MSITTVISKQWVVFRKGKGCSRLGTTSLLPTHYLLQLAGTTITTRLQLKVRLNPNQLHEIEKALVLIEQTTQVNHDFSYGVIVSCTISGAVGGGFHFVEE